jgi:hypothetical protein
MTDVIVDKASWEKLNTELSTICEDARKVNSFMEQRVNTKWEV